MLNNRLKYAVYIETKNPYDQDWFFADREAYDVFPTREEAEACASSLPLPYNSRAIVEEE